MHGEQPARLNWNEMWVPDKGYKCNNLDISMKDMIGMQVIKHHQELHKPHTEFLHPEKLALQRGKIQ